MPKNLGIKIKKIRDSHNLSQERFAIRLGLTGKTISAYETGRTNPPIKVLNKIVEVYDAPFVSMNPESRLNFINKLDLLMGEITDLRELLGD